MRSPTRRALRLADHMPSARRGMISIARKELKRTKLATESEPFATCGRRRARSQPREERQELKDRDVEAAPVAFSSAGNLLGAALELPLLLLAQAAILLVGGRMVANGSLSVASFVRFNLFLAMLIMPLRALGMWIGQAQRATASGERIFQVIDEPEDITDAPTHASSRRPRSHHFTHAPSATTSGPSCTTSTWSSSRARSSR